MPIDELREATRVALAPPSAGVVFYNWHKLDADVARYVAVADVLSSAGVGPRS